MAASAAVTISAALAGSLLLNSVPMYSMFGYVAICSSNPACRCVGGGDARLDVDDHHRALLADQRGQGVGGHDAAQVVVGGDARGTDRLVVHGGVDEDHLDARILGPLQRTGRRLDVVRRDEDGVGSARHHGVDDRVLQRGVEFVGPLHVDGRTEGGRGVLHAALHRDVELVTDHALDERDVDAGARQ